MKNRMTGWSWSCFFAFTLGALANDIQKADNRDALSLGTSWVGGIAPGTNDTAVWDGVVASSGNWTYGFGTNTAWYGLVVTNSASMLTITNDGSTLTLGAGGVRFSEPTNYAFNCTICSPLHLSANQSWSVGSSPLYQWGPVSGEGKLTLTGTGAYAFYEPINLPAGVNVDCWIMHMRENATVTGPLTVLPYRNLWLNKAVDTDWSDTFVGHTVTNNGIFEFGSDGAGIAHVMVTLREGDVLATTSNPDRKTGRVNVVNNNVVQDGGYLGANWFYVNSGCVTQKQGTTFVDYAMYAGYGSASELLDRRVQVEGGTLDVRRLHIGAANPSSYPGIVDITGGLVMASRANSYQSTGIELAAAQTDSESGYSSAPVGLLTVSGGSLRAMQVSFGSTLYPRDSTWNVTNGYARFDLKGGDVTVGAAGMGPSEVWNRTTNVPSDTAQSWYDVNLSGGTLGAYASYTNRARTRLCDDNGGVTIHAADTNGTPYTITMAQPLTGEGSLRKTGVGTLELTAATYTGRTVIAAGTLTMIATSLWTEAAAALPKARAVWVAQSLTGTTGSTVTAWAATNTAIEFNSTVARAVKTWYTSPRIGATPMNGWRVVSFDGMSNALAMTSASSLVYDTSNLTVAVVLRTSTDGVGAMADDWRTKTGIIGQDYDSTWWGIAFCSGGRVGAGVGGSASGTVTAWAPPRNLNDGQPHVFIYSWRNASNVMMNVDGYYSSRYDKPQSGVRAKTRTVLGTSENGSCCKADIAEIRFYSNALDVVSQQALGMELAQKYGAETAGFLTDDQQAQGCLVSPDVRIESGATFQAAAVGTRVRPGQLFHGAGTVGGTLVVGTNGVVQATEADALTVNALMFETGGIYRWQYTAEGASKAMTVGDLTLPQGTVTVDIDAAGSNPAPHGVLMRYTGTLTDNGVTWKFNGGRGATTVITDVANKLLYLSTPTGTIISVR